MSRFNITGLCVADQDYMVDTRNKTALPGNYLVRAYTNLPIFHLHGSLKKFFIISSLYVNLREVLLISDSIFGIGTMFGIFSSNKKNKVKIHNRIFEVYLYNHMSVAKEREDKQLKIYEASQFINLEGDLDIVRIMDKFQELMKTE